MKNLTLLLSFLLIFALSAVCWYILLVDSAVVGALAEWLPQAYATLWGKILFVSFGLLTMACSLSLVALFLGLEPSMTRQVVLKNESGSVGVSLSAIEEFIKRKGKTVAGVRDLSVRAEAVDGTLILQTKVVLELQRNVPEFTKAFQDRILYELENTLGLQNVKEVRVMIHKIYPRESKTETVYLGAPTQLLLKDPDAESMPVEATLVPPSVKSTPGAEAEDESYTVIYKSRNKNEDHE